MAGIVASVIGGAAFKADVRCALLPSLVSDATLKDSLAIVIDVLRATTVVAHAVANGCSRMVPMAHVDERAEVVQREKDILGMGGDGEPGAHYPPKHNIILGGERGGIKIAGFDLGNSPSEYSRERVGGQVVAFCTTNGSVAVRRCTRLASRVATASFVNLSGACDLVQRTLLHGGPAAVAAGAGAVGAASVSPDSSSSTTHHAHSHHSSTTTHASASASSSAPLATAFEGTSSPSPIKRVVIVCAGTDGAVAREDVLCAGAIVSILTRRGLVSSLDDSAMLAGDAWVALETGAQVSLGGGSTLNSTTDGSEQDKLSRLRSHLYSTLAATQGGMNIAKLGFDADIRACAAVDLLPGIAPELFEHRYLQQSKS